MRLLRLKAMFEECNFEFKLYSVAQQAMMRYLVDVVADLEPGEERDRASTVEAFLAWMDSAMLLEDFLKDLLEYEVYSEV